MAGHYDSIAHVRSMSMLPSSGIGEEIQHEPSALLF
jgi:hypothetical protein